MTFNKETIKRRSALFLFWSWHFIYTILALFLVLPYLVAPLLKTAMEDTTPWHYVIYALLIAILPFVSMYLGARYFQKNYRLLMKYFYGFEMPFLFFLIVRIFTFRDDGLAVHWLMLNVLLGLAAWLVFLLVQQRNETNDTPLQNHWLGTIGSTLLLGVGLYFGSIFLIIQAPNAVEFTHELGNILSSFRWSDITDILLVIINPLWWLLGLFILFTCSLFLILPLAMIYLYVGQFLQRLPSFNLIHWALVIVVVAVNIAVMHSATQQTQQQVFSTLEADDPISSAEFSAQREAIREGLLNAYLARYRYMSTTHLSQRIQRNYQDTFGLSKASAAIPQDIFNTLLKPFLYDGEDWGDKSRAETHYNALFDAPIQKAERELILKTIKHTWDMTRDNEAGLLDASNEYVYLEQQSIDVTEQGSVATVTIQQTLRNLTNRPKETVLHFSLPEEAVLTGVWLSDEKDQLLKYPYALAPKGAAQAVYKAEVKRRVDPALLEQTGPYQYRLRVYPVLGKAYDAKLGEPLYARFSYQTLADKKGHWPVPKLLEKRNIFWDSDTNYRLNGKALYHNETLDSFPKTLASRQSGGKNSELSFQLASQTIQAIPREVDLETLPKSGRFAVVIDGSYSMQDHYPSALKTLEQLKQKAISFDAYFCKKDCQALSDKPEFFGDSQTLDHLQAFERMDHGKQYNSVLVLTDAGSYELADENNRPLNLARPLWLVHLGDSLPYAYDDKVLDTIYRSRGGITTSALEALRRTQLLANNDSASNPTLPEKSTLVSVSEQYLWLAKPKTSETLNTKRPANIAAAHWLRHLTRHMDTQKLDTLDEIHRIAKANNIVTHYSSMLVLVNDRQKEALKKAEEADDRFDREVETGKQNATAPTDPFAVPAVPEPEEWALIIIAMMLLSTTLWRRRLAA